MRRLVQITILLLVIVAVVVVPSQAQSEATTINEDLPVYIEQFVPCAADGEGEYVIIQGTLHLLVHYTFHEDGTYHGVTHRQPQGLTGVGLTTGDTYRATGVSQDNVTLHVNENYYYEANYIDSYNIIGPGPDNNYKLHVNYHYIINANGDPKVWLESSSVTCR